MSDRGVAAALRHADPGDDATVSGWLGYPGGRIDLVEVTFGDGDPRVRAARGDVVAVAQSFYRLADFWAEFAHPDAALWKAFAKANWGPTPDRWGEARTIEDVIQRKIRDEAWFLPNGTAKTRTGKALVIVLLTMSGGRQPV